MLSFLPVDRGAVDEAYCVLSCRSVSVPLHCHFKATLCLGSGALSGGDRSLQEHAVKAGAEWRHLPEWGEMTLCSNTSLRTQQVKLLL